MLDIEVAGLVVTCLNQKINGDPMVIDGEREWWYISPLYRKDQEEPDMSAGELVERIRLLNLTSIKEVVCSQMMNQQFIQIRGNREEIIKECLTIK